MTDQITVERTGSKCWNLYINGVKRNLPYFRNDKKGIEKYLKEHYDIDLRTDLTITRKGYKEFSTRQVKQENGVALIIKTFLKT